LQLAFAPAGRAWDDTRDGLPLWEVQGHGNTVYLLGSIHLLRPEAYPLDPAIYEAFDAAQTVAFEIDLEEMMQGSVEMMTRGALPPGRTLSDVLPADVYAELERRVAGMPMPLAALQGLKPWLVSMTLSVLSLQQAGYDASMGLDMHFHLRAREVGKQTMGLETVKDQIDAM